MKNIRLIPRLDVKGPNVIKGIQLECLRIVGDPETLATKYYQDGADELIYIDIVASLYNRQNLVDIVSHASKHIFIPLTAGGGIRSLKDIDQLLRAGADKVAINTWATKHPSFINQASKMFGSQCIVASIEAKKKDNFQWEAYTENGRQPTGLDVISWAQKLENLGAGEILITSIDKDGTKRGYDYELISTVNKSVSIPVIASGGAGSLDDITKVIETNPDAIAIGSLLHYNNLSIKDIKKYLNLT